MLLACLAFTVAVPALAGTPDARSIPPARRRQIQDAYGQLPLSFERNQGQLDRKVEFVSRGSGYSLFLTRTAAVLSLECDQDHSAALRVRLVGAQPRVHVSGLEALPGQVNYFVGRNPSEWHTGVPTYRKVSYEGVYPGINLVYYGNQRQLEYDFVVAPGARPDAIAMEFQGADRIEIDSQGDLVLQIAGREIREHKPAIYQEVDGRRKLVEGRYALRGKARVGFSIARYDTSKPLTIDPTLAYSTYLGGSRQDSAYAIAVDASGNAFVAGSTGSTNFPTTSGVYQTTNLLFAAFVTKLNATGTALVYSTFLGGSGGDQASAIAVDASGNAYVAGTTASTDFPTTTGAFQTTYGGGFENAFVTKLNASGTALLYSTYLGGNNTNAGDEANGVAVDASGNAYVTGVAGSANFPTTPGAFQTTLGAAGNAFVTKLNTTGAKLVYSTFLGGSGQIATFGDQGNAIALDASENAYVVGSTGSSDFPVTSSGFQTKYGGGDDDVFVTKLNATGTALIYSTFLGGIGLDLGQGIALDASGNAYVTGSTTTTAFPTTPGAYKTTIPGPESVFVTKLNASGSTLVYSTFLGGSDEDQGTAIAVDSSGNASVTGFAISDDFPTTSDAFQPAPGNPDSQNAFFTKFNVTGTALVYSTYLGPSGGKAIAIDVSDNVYLTGIAAANFPTTTGAYQTKFGGGSDAFVAKFLFAAPTVPDLTITASHTGSFTRGQTGTTYTVTAKNSGTGPTGGTVTVVDTLPAGLTATAIAGTNWVCTLATLTCKTTTVEAAGASFPAITLTVNVAANAASSLTNSATVSGGGETTTSNDSANDPTTVTAATLSSIAITAPNSSIAKGGADQFKAIGTFSDGSTSDITASVTWNSDNLAAVTINASGLATGAGVGLAHVTAKQGSVTSNSFPLTVTAATLTSIAITAPNSSIAKGGTDQFKAIGAFSDGSTSDITASVTWNSDNLAAVTINASGLATGAGVGSAHITAKQGSVTSNSLLLTVTRATPLITWVNPANLAFGSALGSTQLNATANIPGTFVYNPRAGTVLLPGAHQTLSVTFTPADTTNFTTGAGRAAITINPVPTSGPPQMVVTSVLSRDPHTGNIVVLATLANAGASQATNVQLTIAKIGSTIPITVMPVSSGNIASGNLAQITLQFPGSIGTTGSNTTLTLNGTYTVGTFGATVRIQLP